LINSALEAAPGHSAICQWTAWMLEQQTVHAQIHGLGTGGLFSDNFPSPVALQPPNLVWKGLPGGWLL
jgi:hypothetical protein